MSAISIAPGDSRERFDGYADFARAQANRYQANRYQAQGSGQVPEVVSANAVLEDGERSTESMVWGEDGFTFGDVLDMINPLQHIPIISDIYRAITGDEIAPGARMVGGGLLGGVPGLAIAAVNTAINEMAIASLFGDDTPTDITGDTAIAALSTAPAPVQPPVQAPVQALARPIGLQFASAPPEATTPPAIPGAAAGSSTPAAPPPLSGGINFFNMNAHQGPAQTQVQTANTASAPQPGALRNTLFQPLAGLPQGPSTASAQPAAAGNSPAPVNLALVNQNNANQAAKPKAAAIPPVPSPATEPENKVFADNGLTPEQQKKANRDALLAAARDLRAAFQGHKAYKTADRLNTLQTEQDNPASPRPTQ